MLLSELKLLNYSVERWQQRWRRRAVPAVREGVGLLTQQPASPGEVETLRHGPREGTTTLSALPGHHHAAFEDAKQQT